MESTRGYWVDAGSSALNRYDRKVFRHGERKPRSCREDRDRLISVAQTLYPSTSDFQFRGGVLRFRWNDGEGSGSIYEAATTPGPTDFMSTKDAAQRVEP